MPSPAPNTIQMLFSSMKPTAVNAAPQDRVQHSCEHRISTVFHSNKERDCVILKDVIGICTEDSI